MKSQIQRRLRKLVRNIPGLLMGYNPYVDADKVQLIDRTYRDVYRSATSFADLGGVWKVNGAYARYTLRKHGLARGVLVDTDFPRRLREKLSRTKHLQTIQGDFSSMEVATSVGFVDVVYFFDVLLHQANPSWDAVLGLYASSCSCMVIFNQQYIHGNTTVRLIDMPLQEYLQTAPRGRERVYRHIYEHADEMHPTYGKPWRDIHNVFQWGITDQGLRAQMETLGFREAFYANCGQFSNLSMFENHAFIFLRDN